jgi:hypothetical protein
MPATTPVTLNVFPARASSHENAAKAPVKATKAAPSTAALVCEASTALTPPSSPVSA